MLQLCKNGHEFDPQLTTFCPECPIPGLDLSDVGPSYGSRGLGSGGGNANARPAPGASAAASGSGAESARNPRDQAAGAKAPRTTSKTVAYYPGISDAAAGSTAASVDPVVGWLVAHKGPALGRDFPVRWGSNPIGRADDEMISIEEDLTIHSHGHAFIVYDPEDNMFWLQPGDGQHRGAGQVRIDGALLLKPEPVGPYSLIRIGKTELIFVPLCGDAFRWNLGGDGEARA